MQSQMVDLCIAARGLYLPGMFPKRCACGRVYTLRAWLRLHYVGVMDGRGRIPDLEMRDCFCRSTMAVKLAGHKEARCGM